MNKKFTARITICDKYNHWRVEEHWVSRRTIYLDVCGEAFSKVQEKIKEYKFYLPTNMKTHIEWFIEVGEVPND